ncbi:MAG: NAD(P)H-dependent oxidoreductase [Candidatus Saccharibacteria bacterium]
MKLAVILGTTRKGRQSVKEAKWIVKEAQKMQDTEVELLDLADYPMPFFDEAASPRYNPDRKPEGTVKKWLDKISEADAYIFITPEYNHSIPAVLKNAFDYLDWQMNRKPATVASHGSVGGARATMHLKEIISESKAVPIQQAVAFHGISEGIDDEGNLSAELAANPYGPQTALNAALEELKWYSDALAKARG